MRIRADRRLAMKKIISVLAILVAFALSSQATWAGESFQKVYSDENVDAYKYHKTSLFGRDLAGVTIVGKQKSQSPILRLQYGSTTVSETTTTFSRCKERKEGRLTQAYFVGEEKKVIKQAGFHDAVNPANGQQAWSTTVGGDGPSTGNLAVPALISGGAFVGGNAVAPGMSVVTNAVVKGVSATGGKGGSAFQAQGQKSVNDNANNNALTNTNTGTNTNTNSATGTGTGTAAATSN